MSESIYFNEIDLFVSGWLRNLFADATIDSRSIVDVQAQDVDRFKRCHFFAGITGWELALQLAGWPAEREVWTGSCPCQPFSCAGKRKGHEDERHLWPEFFRLIRECRPAVVFGEQVAAKDGREWLDGISLDLENLGYAVGAADLCAASTGTKARNIGSELYSAIEESCGPELADEFWQYWLDSGNYAAFDCDSGAPHIRQRLFWVANLPGGRFGEHRHPQGSTGHVDECGATNRLANAEYLSGCTERIDKPRERTTTSSHYATECGGTLERLANTDGRQPRDRGLQRRGRHMQLAADESTGGLAQRRLESPGRSVCRPKESNGSPNIGSSDQLGGPGDIGGLGLPDRAGSQQGRQAATTVGHGCSVVAASCAGGLGYARKGRLQGFDRGRDGFESTQSSPWSDYDLIPCADGKVRRVESKFLTMVDGIPRTMGPISARTIAEIEREITNYANAEKKRPGETVRLLWHSLVKETVQWGFGGLPDFLTAPVLLSFLRQLAYQGWHFSESVLRSSEETQETLLRSLWWKNPFTRPSYRRGLEEQRPGEPANAMRVLPSILARHVQESWGDAIAANAADGFPLANGVKNRVGKLRAYGNAIVPQVAAAFIRAFMESVGMGSA